MSISRKQIKNRKSKIENGHAYCKNEFYARKG